MEVEEGKAADYPDDNPVRSKNADTKGAWVKLDTIIFDLDGTLVDTAGDLTASLNHALASLGREIVTVASVRQMVGHGVRALMERGLGATGQVDEDAIEHGMSLFLDHYEKNIAVHSRPFPGVEEALTQFADDGWKLAICTNKSVDLARLLVGELGLDRWIPVLLGVGSREYRKPDPRILFDTLSEAGGEMPLFVGDSKTDADTAKAANVPLVLTTYGYTTTPIRTLDADVVIEHFAELPAAVRSVQEKFKGGAATSRP